MRFMKPGLFTGRPDIVVARPDICGARPGIFGARPDIYCGPARRFGGTVRGAVHVLCRI